MLPKVKWFQTIIVALNILVEEDRDLGRSSNNVGKNFDNKKLKPKS